MSLLAALALSVAQAGSAPGTPSAPVPLASPQQEEAAVRAAVTDLLSIISGPVGQPRDWARFRKAFTPGARVQAITRSGLMGGSVEDYVSQSAAGLERLGFSEKQLVTRVQLYGHLAHVWSSYDLRSADGKVAMRGINSFQMARQPDGRWLVHSLLWQREYPELPLPADMAAPAR